MRVAYADPPYPGRAKRYYGREPSYAGEVDHVALIASLKASYDGWALSTSADALRDLLPLCPPDVRVCAWVKPVGACPATYGLHNCWEPLLVVPARSLRPGVRDWISAQPARFGGNLPGRKPLAFAAWLFDCLGLLPGDELVDLFPGTGIIGRAWAEASLGAVGTRRFLDAATADVVEDLADASQEYSGDASLPGADDAPASADAFQAAPGDVSPKYSRDVCAAPARVA